MKPVRHAHANICYRGTTPDVGDLWCMRDTPGQIIVVYELDDHERKLILMGGRIMLGISTEPIPPVSMQVIEEEHFRPVAEHPWKDIPELEDEERR